MLTVSFIFLRVSPLEKKCACSPTADLETVWNDEKRLYDKAWEKEGHKKDFNILRVQSFFVSLWRLGDIVLKCVWVEVPALSIVRYINCTVIILLRLLGSHCSCQDAAPYKCTGLPRVPSSSKQMSQNTTLSISQDRWESVFNRW